MDQTLNSLKESGAAFFPDGVDFALRRNATPPDERFALHYHNHYEAFFALSGDMVYTVEGRLYRLEAGNLLIIAPYELHQLLSSGSGGAERISLRFRCELLARLSTPDCNLGTYFENHAPGYQNLLKLNESQQRQLADVLNGLLRETSECSFGSSLAASTFLTQFFLLVNRAVVEGAQAAPPPDPAALLVQQAVEYMEQNYASPISLEDLSRHLGVDRYSLSRGFTRLVGCPPHRFLIQKRLQRVEQLLRNGIPPQDAAYQCGFSDYTNFYRRFRAAYGVSPRNWLERTVRKDEEKWAVREL